jgi:putative ABC transport system substrate-binding protein
LIDLAKLIVGAVSQLDAPHLWGAPAAADETAKVWRVGVLAPAPLRPIESFKAQLRGLGWVEGKNVRFDYRWAEGNDSRYPALAAELVALPSI